MKENIVTVCLNCGKKYGQKYKEVFGCWTDTCDICFKKNVVCASAPHDFGIYSNKNIKISDRMSV